MTASTSLEDLPPPPPETLSDRLTYWRYRLLWDFVAGLPEPLARRLPGTAGRLWYRAAPSRQREQVRRNLARVAGHPPEGELEDLVRAAYVSYARYWVDSFRLHRMDPSRVLERSGEEGLVALDRMAASGRGGILATAHLGSWDVGALFTRERGWRLTVVAEVLRPRRLFERFVRLRRQAGLGVIPLVRGGDVLARLEEVVADGSIATLLADRDLTGRGPVVDFFGEPCRLPSGPAALARRTGRPVVVGAFVTDGAGWRGVARPPVDVAGLSVVEGTRVVARELEALIGRFPEQWHVFVPTWQADRRPGRRGARTDGAPRDGAPRDGTPSGSGTPAGARDVGGRRNGEGAPEPSAGPGVAGRRNAAGGSDTPGGEGPDRGSG